MHTFCGMKIGKWTQTLFSPNFNWMQNRVTLRHASLPQLRLLTGCIKETFTPSINFARQKQSPASDALCVYHLNESKLTLRITSGALYTFSLSHRAPLSSHAHKAYWFPIDDCRIYFPALCGTRAALHLVDERKRSNTFFCLSLKENTREEQNGVTEWVSTGKIIARARAIFCPGTRRAGGDAHLSSLCRALLSSVNVRQSIPRPPLRRPSSNCSNSSLNFLRRGARFLFRDTQTRSVSFVSRSVSDGTWKRLKAFSFLLPPVRRHSCECWQMILRRTHKNVCFI